jgi:hypothetical protein
MFQNVSNCFKLISNYFELFQVAVLSLKAGGYEVDSATFALLGRHKHLIRSFGVSTPPGGNEGTDDLLVVELARLGSLDKYFAHHGLFVDHDGTKNVTDVVLLRVAMQVGTFSEHSVNIQ